MPWIVGDSFGGVQQAQTAEDAQNRAAFANSMANLMAGLRERNNQRLAQQSLDLQKAYQQAQMSHATAELDLKKQEAQWRNQLGQEHNRISQEYIDLQKSALNQNNPAQIRNQDFEAQQASQQADRGLFGTTDDVPYPWMSEAQKNVLVQQSLQARQQREAAYNSANGLAALLNKHKQLTDQRDKAKAIIDATPWYRKNPADVQKKLDDANKQLTELTPRVNRIVNDPRLSSLAYLDPDQDKFVPAVPAPSWIKQPGTATARTNTRTATQGSDTGNEMSAGGGLPQPAPATVGAVPVIPDNPPSGPMNGQGQTMGTATQGSSGRRKYPSSVYDQTNWYIGQGLQPADALRKALAGDNALFGDNPGPLQ